MTAPIGLFSHCELFSPSCSLITPYVTVSVDMPSCWKAYSCYLTVSHYLWQ